jgi:hypothetical protein
MARESFTDTYDPNKSYELSGSLLNKMARQANALSLVRPGDYEGIHSHAVRGSAYPPPAILGIAIVKEATNTCPASGLSPCATLNRYTCRFRYWDHATVPNQWVEIDEDLHMDAAGFWEPTPTDASETPTSGAGFGHIPTFVKGDTVPAYWDEQRGMLIPLAGVFQDAPRAEFMSDTIQEIPKLSDQVTDAECGLSYVEFVIERRIGFSAADPWTQVGHLKMRVPVADENSWADTASTFCLISAPIEGVASFAQLRVRMFRTVNYTVNCIHSRIQLVGAGRDSATNYSFNADIHSGFRRAGGAARKGWNIMASVEGRFKDSPLWNTRIGDGDVIETSYLDPIDGWIVAVNLVVTIGNARTSAKKCPPANIIRGTAVYDSETEGRASVTIDNIKLIAGCDPRGDPDDQEEQLVVTKLQACEHEVGTEVIAFKQSGT